MTEPAPLPKRIVIASQKLGMGKIGSIAMSHDGSKIYLGRRTSYDRSRLNLGVLSLDPAGQPIAKPKLYPDSDVPKQFDHASTIARILVNPARAKLYLAVIYESFSTELPNNLTVYDLDAQGEPIVRPAANNFPKSPRTYDSGNPQKWVTALALHPSLPLLYMVGYGADPSVYVYHLTKDGEPIVAPPSAEFPSGSPFAFKINNTWKVEVAVTGGGKRLYLATGDSGSGKTTIEVVDLDLNTGLPLSGPGHIHSFPVPPTPNPNLTHGPFLGGPFLFHYTPQALYRRHPLLPVQSGNYWKIPDVWPLYVCRWTGWATQRANRKRLRGFRTALRQSLPMA
jgi:hypothetical protein